ncbi:MAG: tRNA (guanosine(37)-N1)-methyltransferase TrmD [Microgenomates group bacterium]
MKIYILTLFPKMFSGFCGESIIKKAQEKNLVKIEIVDLRQFAYDKRGSVDDRVYGGGKGMIIRADVVYKAILNIKNQKSKLQIKNQKQKIILTSPKGKIFNQQKALQLSKLDKLVIICGHYEGIDERIKNFVDEELSLGDFVLTGGEIVAAAIVDAVVRLIPGVLDKEAINKESFSQYKINYLIKIIGENKILKKLKERNIKKVKLLEYPQYTRPENFLGLKVPKILLSGNHKEIEKWRIKKAWEETLKKRKDLLEKQLDKRKRKKL